MTSDPLFLWSAPEAAESWYVSDICICNVNRVIGSLSNGNTSTVVAVDPSNGKKVAEWNEVPTTVVSVGYCYAKSVLYAFDKEGTIWQLDIRSSNICSSFSSAISTRWPNCIANTGAVSSDEHSLAVAITVSNDGNKKKKKRNIGDDDIASDSDDESYEPFTYSIELCDARNMSTPVCSYNRSHSDDIQTLRFSIEQPSSLMSGGADGLVNIFETRITDEDDALQSTNQMDSSVSRVGFLSSNRAYALTDDNRYSLLKLSAADDVDVVFRRKYTNDGHFLVDILDCGRNECVYLLESTADGKAIVYNVPNDGYKIHKVRQFEGHNDLIRCVHYDFDQRLLVSGGDDGHIVGYELMPPNVDVYVAKGKPKEKSSRQKPYSR
uniref:WD repeat-containing protein 89 n=1 Tax=Parascaris univalens TaxID=6257 RepID=A0A915BXP9_PARUN